MTMELQQNTAVIYEFPIRNPQRVRELRERASLKPVLVDCGAASWYHEEAIRALDENRKQ